MVEAPTEAEADGRRRPGCEPLSRRLTAAARRSRGPGRSYTVHARCAESSPWCGAPRRRAARAGAAADASSTRPSRASAADGRRPRRRRRCEAAAAAVQTVARTLRGPLGAGALIADPVARGRVRAPGRRDRPTQLVAIEAHARQRGRRPTPRTPTTSRRATPRSSRARTRCGRSQWDRLGDRPRDRRSRRPRPARARRARGLPLDPGRALGARPARGARPRLRRASTCSSPVTISTSPTPTSPG